MGTERRRKRDQECSRLAIDSRQTETQDSGTALRILAEAGETPSASCGDRSHLAVRRRTLFFSTSADDPMDSLFQLTRRHGPQWAVFWLGFFLGANNIISA